MAPGIRGGNVIWFRYDLVHLGETPGSPPALCTCSAAIITSRSPPASMLGQCDSPFAYASALRLLIFQRWCQCGCARSPSPAVTRLCSSLREAIWAAGPLTKGSTLCHGIGGNGYAFLKLYARTGDVRWLARARAFAMHAITQTETAAERYDQMRYSMWTGDLGVAIYLWNCMHASAVFPTLDVFLPLSDG